jgi:hypothetical protein
LPPALAGGKQVEERAALAEIKIYRIPNSEAEVEKEDIFIYSAKARTVLQSVH